FSSSSQTEISAGSSVSLSCQLYLYSFAGVSCDDWISSQGIDLLWVNQAGDKLKISDSRYQISAPGHCIITLTTTLLNEDDNREWRCEVTQGDQVKTSATYTVKISAQDKTMAAMIPDSKNHKTTKSSETKAQADSTTAVTPVHISNSQNHRETQPAVSSSPLVISVSAAAFAVFLLVVFCLIWRKRAGNKRGTDGSVKDENEDKGTYETINMSIPAAARDNEQTDDVTYANISSSWKKASKITHCE
ncbi:hypothetical protein QQF64_026010, partial [Cirrhinus molitorella]